MDTWRTWELVLPVLEREHDVLALTFPGHAGGPPMPEPITAERLPDFVARAMDAAGFETAHIAGNSLGGFVALQLAERGRARSVTALAPAGGWDGDMTELFARQRDRAVSLGLLVEHSEHIPPELADHLAIGMARCVAAPAMLDFAEAADWALDPEAIGCTIRIVWGTADRLLPWPDAAARYRRLFPHAEWIELEGVGHAPQLDVPTEVGQLLVAAG